MKITRPILPLLGSIALLLPAGAADIVKLNNTNALNLAGSWSGGLVPTTADTMLWDSTFTAVVPRTVGALSSMGADLSVLGLKVTNAGGTLNAATTGLGIQSANSANTLTIGAGGIDLSTATQTLYIESKIALSANQNWVINNANTNANPTGFGNNEDLAFRAMTAASATTANTAFNMGGFTINASGTGQVTISSGYAMTNGTINVGNNLFLIGGGDTRALTLGADVNLNVAAGSTLQFQANSGITTSNAAIALNGGTLKLVNNNAANQITVNNSVAVNAASTLLVGNTVGGGSVASTNGIIFNANLTGAASLTMTNNASTISTLVIGGNNSGYSGTISMGGTAGRIFRLNTANSGSAAATWNVGTGVTLQVNGVSVNLGTLTGAGSVASVGSSTIAVGAGNFTGAVSGAMTLSKTGTGTLTLSGANTHTGPTNVNGGTLVVSPGTLAGTTVTVASGATLVAQTAASGTLNVPVTVNDGGTISARPLAAGQTTTVPSLALGSATGGTFTIDTGLLGNPTAAPLSANTFNPVSGSIFKVTGAALALGTFPGLSYTTIGGGGFGGLSLSLPFRVGGSLINNAGSVDVQITAISKPTWSGAVNGNWNIDTVGNGSVGTANWTATSGPNTYVESAALGNDTVVFNDSATGTTTVNLTTALSPNGVTFANIAKDYTLNGTGRLTGSSAISKSGAGRVTIANSGNNDFTGGALITDGTLAVGDGVNAGNGTLGSGAVAITAPGVLELNRPDNFTFANALSGSGTLRKSQAGIATIPTAASLAGAVQVDAGELRFSGGGNLSGIVSGAGALTVSGGTLQLSGSDANTLAGLTTVSGGTLQLNKTGVNAIAGNLLFTGTGLLTLSQTNQIADTATITYDKAINGGTIIINETVAAITMLNGSDTAAQVQAANGFNVTGLLTANNTSVFAVASNNSGSVGGLSMSGTPIIRIAGNSNPSTLTVGALGITASGGTIQIGQGTGAFDAVLNLGGNLTTTGNLAITDGAFVGANLRQLNLGADIRTFNIGAGTTTTIAPDIAGTGGIIKTGNGTLQLTAASASNYTGDTTVAAGTFITTPAQVAGNVFVNTPGTFNVTQTGPGTTFTATAIYTDPGATITLSTGAFGNPTVPAISLTDFVPSPTTLRVTGTALVPGTNIPLIDYVTLGNPFSNLTLSLPGRIAGVLVDNAVDTRVDLNITGTEQVKWNGNVSNVWDIDPDTTGALGTPNWKTTISNVAARYFQGVVATDTANFDDSATGTTTVNLSTILTPGGTTVNNSTKTYTFAGTGRLSGTGALNKTGNGTLILANAVAYDHTGGTNIDGGTLQVGDGVTNGVGFLPAGTITDNAAIVFNRPDDLNVAATIGGTGSIVKNNGNTVTFSAAATNALSHTVNAGTLRYGGAATLSGPITIAGGGASFAGGGTLSGDISGAGTLSTSAGTLQITGSNANTNTGLTTVSGGVLQLNKPTGINAVGGDITISGTGQIGLLAQDQIPDTATVNFLGSSTDSFPGQVGSETIGNLIVNSSVGGAPGGQVIMRNGFNVAGLATLSSGVLGVGSGQTATLNSVNITGTGTTNAILRVAGNSAASTLNIGPGGITASGGEIQIKFNTNAQDAVLNLGGNFTTTGNVIVTNGGYTGANLNVINLTADRTFDIGSGTTTTVDPDIAGTGGLTKTGSGTLQINPSSGSTYAGSTFVNAGTLDLRGSISGSSVVVTNTGTFAGTGSVTTGGGAFIVALGGKLAPGTTTTVGTLTVNTGTGAFDVSITDPGTLLFDIASVGASDQVILSGGNLQIGDGVLNFDDFAFTALGGIVPDTDYVLFDASTPIGGFLGTSLSGPVGGEIGTLTIGDGGNDLILHIVPEPGSAALLLGGLAMLAVRRRRM